MKKNQLTLRQRNLLVLALSLTITHFSYARQGMWIPSLLKELNETDLAKMGLQLPVAELFRNDSTGLNNAIVQFGGGCTGEIVSNRGLLFTNHHCGFSQIQMLSTMQHNYLEDGYWAKNDSEEIPCPGLTVTFIRQITEVTVSFQYTLNQNLSEIDRDKKVKQISDSLEKSMSLPGRKILIRPFFGGNRYFAFVTEIFKDIRFVGAPPSSIGNFGGETDNWMWPRHTGDFSIFRIYANKENAPAEYAKENIPYRPSRSLTINMTGFQENEFTMVYGFPGRTQQFLSSSAIDLIEQQTNPNRIALRDIRMNIWREGMETNDTVELQYASKFRSLANSYKRWKGELIGLKSEDVVKRKKTEESLITDEKGRKLIRLLNQAVDSSRSINFINDYYTEGLNTIELYAIAGKFKILVDQCQSKKIDTAAIRITILKLNEEVQSFYKNYNALLDEQVCRTMLLTCSAKLTIDFQPEFLRTFSKNPDKYLRQLFSNSLFTAEAKIRGFLIDFDYRKINKIINDPAYSAAIELSTMRSGRIDNVLVHCNEKINRLQRDYIGYILESDHGGMIAPDANSTLRVSYGKVEGMTPTDGVHYDYMTTSDGILAKQASGNSDYILQPNISAIFEKRDFGRYATSGKLPVAFLASNHTTGGNSGSPLLNAKGELIGINFDRIWEGVMSDLYFNPSLSRNVSVDIRYVLFVIDQIGNDSRLFNEMEIRWQ